ncbi:MAG: hypothetical protein HOE90_09825 [Bacteriovoracaceae bacterium]|jgi:hypothetical protein|nr:hypothetical protein [Bacteriovoracaceae bacterium]
MSTEPKNEYCRVPIKLILEHGDDFPFDIYLKLGPAKIIKLSHRNEDIKETFLRYKEKGVEDVFVLQREMSAFIKQLRKNMANRFFDSGTLPTREAVSILDSGYMVTKEAFMKLGVNETTLAVAKEVNEFSVKMLKKVPNIFEFFKQFREDCEKSFMKQLMVAYSTSCMIDTFDWKSQQIKEKTAMAAMLCDVLLTESQIELVNQAEKVADGDWDAHLPREILEHPTKLSSMLMPQRHTISTETIGIIEVHHELPNGDGFPRGITADRLTLLPCIYIVANKFITLMIDSGFDYRQRDSMLQTLEDNYSRGNFKKAVRSLYKMLGMVV